MSEQTSREPDDATLDHYRKGDLEATERERVVELERLVGELREALRELAGVVARATSAAAKAERFAAPATAGEEKA